MSAIIENPVKQKRGRPRASLTKFDGPPESTKPKKITSNKRAEAEARLLEREAEKREYKEDMQRYLKARLKQGKAKLKLEASIKQLEARLLAL